MTHTLPLLLALASASDPTAASPDAEAVEVHDFATLNPGDAARLEGKRAVYRVRVTGVGLNRIFDVDAPAGAIGRLRIDGYAATGPHVVQAELHLEYDPLKAGKSGAPPGVWVYRLAKAAIVGPCGGLMREALIGKLSRWAAYPWCDQGTSAAGVGPGGSRTSRNLACPLH